ncbi:tripartite tricarboxylate transporter permease [Psychromarinibacter sp. C21-152]|uniref:Tripartite tricarboxylate transporter permease n=1 Tax=Psychromarinibacter sediminicola TaxID=3033385 RepID=A0AAE3T9E2_9RHOB|nr:tripartite tricarboxylate transporter permease [Psychromarinibacter sediminicola]MDF0600460.1 tripartite tricarboxylate transporter permease [Psychromarinibacter sediminicola]
MDLIANLAIGFDTALTPANLFYCFAGALLGTFIGVLPGLGPTATVAMLLPVTYYLSPEASLIMLAGIYYGSQYGGSTTAILVNLPGEVSSSVTAIDGYQMARQGEAGKALAIAAIGSFCAGTFATFLIAVVAIPLSAIALKFGSAEYFALILLGLVTSTALAHGSVLRAIAMIIAGMLFGIVGTDVDTGAYRFTLGIVELIDGLSVVAVALGIFGIVEVLKNLENKTGEIVETAKITSLMPTRKDLRAAAGPVARGSVVGSLLGTLPGGGSILSAFTSYMIEKRISKHPERFGKGAIEGVAGPESANNAGAQTSFVPLLTLGIPSHPLMALMMGALLIQGITPGPNVVHTQPGLFWGIIASMWIGNAMLVVLNLPLVGLWVAMLRVPYKLMIPAIVTFSTIGVFTVKNSGFDVQILAAFGLIGYLLHKVGCEPAPFLMGFVLGSLLEEHLRRAMVFSRGDPMVFLTHPISATLLGVAVVVLALIALPAISRRREEIFIEEE